MGFISLAEYVNWYGVLTGRPALKLYVVASTSSFFKPEYLQPHVNKTPQIVSNFNLESSDVSSNHN